MSPLRFLFVIYLFFCFIHCELSAGIGGNLEIPSGTGFTKASKKTLQSLTKGQERGILVNRKPVDANCSISSQHHRKKNAVTPAPNQQRPSEDVKATRGPSSE